MRANNWKTDVSERYPIPFPIVIGKGPIKRNIEFESICFEQPNTEEKTMSMERYIQNAPYLLVKPVR